MKHGCIDVEQIASVLELPPGHEQRRHLDSCPRCRNLARSYTAFLKAEAGAGARPEEARERLAQAILRATGAAARPGSAREDLPQRETGSRRAWWPLWRLRPVVLVAAAAVAFVAVVLWQDRPTAPPVLRDERTLRTGTLLLHPAQVTPGGTVRLSWSRASGAERYEVRVYDAELDEVYRHPAVMDTSVVVRLSDIPGPAGSPGLIWRVHAFRGKDAIAVSPPGSIPQP